MEYNNINFNIIAKYIENRFNSKLAYSDSMLDMEVYKNICYISDMIDILSRYEAYDLHVLQEKNIIDDVYKVRGEISQACVHLQSAIKVLEQQVYEMRQYKEFCKINDANDQKGNNE